MVTKIMHNKRNKKGFTLVELLVAITILAVGLLAVASMQGVAVKSDMVANRNSVATSLAQQIQEDLLASSLTGTMLNTATVGQNYFPPPSNSITIRGAGTFSAIYTIEPNASIISVGTVTGTTRVVVTVFYNAPNGVQIPTTFTSYKRAI